MLKFHLVTDTHFYPYQELGISDHRDQITLNESGAIIDAAFEKLLADTSTDLVLIAGDLTNNGQKAAHLGFTEKLRRLQAGGKRVFVITASHDYGQTTFDDPGDNPKEGVTYRRELRQLYHDFGIGQALSVCEDRSYVAQLAPGFRLLAMNNDSSGHDYSSQLPWALEQIRLARAEGQFIFAIHHYPILAPSPIYPIIGGSSNMAKESQTLADALADAGCHFVFTGHTHMQNITHSQTAKGNLFYEINTGALVGCPAPIRKVEIDASVMRIRTEYVEQFDWDLQGKSVSQYLNDNFDQMLNRIFDAAGTDVRLFVDILAGEFHVPKDVLLKYRFFVKIGGKFLNRVTLGGLGCLFFCRSKLPREARKVKLRWLIVETVRNIYCGDEPYSQDTPIGGAAFILLGRLDKLLGRFLKGELPFGGMQPFVMSLLYDPTPDTNADLAIPETCV